MSDEFEDVSARVPMWDATTTKDESGNTVPLKATENSHITGYFLGTKTFENPKKAGSGEMLTVHSIHATAIGDEAHNGGDPLPEGGATRDFWGNTVLNSLLEEEITPGQKIRVVYLGMEESKAKRKYKNFKLQVSTNAEPVKVDNGRIVKYDPATTASANPEDKSAGAPNKEVEATASAATNAEEVEDDLPF